MALASRELSPTSSALGWRPIETAPKDGNLFLLAVRGGDDRRTFVASADFPPAGFRWITHSVLGWDALHGGWEPYAWMPIPDPPQ